MTFYSHVVIHFLLCSKSMEVINVLYGFASQIHHFWIHVSMLFMFFHNPSSRQFLVSKNNYLRLENMIWDPRSNLNGLHDPPLDPKFLPNCSQAGGGIRQWAVPGPTHASDS